MTEKELHVIEQRSEMIVKGYAFLLSWELNPLSLSTGKHIVKILWRPSRRLFVRFILLILCGGLCDATLPATQT